MGLVTDKKEAIVAEIAVIVARQESPSAYLGEVEFGSARKRAVFAEARRERDVERRKYLEAQLSQLTATFGGRSKVIRNAV